MYYTHIFGLKKTHTIKFMLKEQDKTFVASNQAQFFFYTKTKKTADETFQKEQLAKLGLLLQGKPILIDSISQIKSV